MRAKMSKQDFLDLFPTEYRHFKTPDDGLTMQANATKKHHRHTHKPTWKPPKAKLSPAEYRRRTKQANKAKKLTRSQA